MNLLSPVSSIMTHNPVSVSPDDPLIKVDSIFKKHRIHHVPVTDAGKLVGIISKSDFFFFKRGFHESSLIDKMEEIRMHNYSVKDIMTTKLAKLNPTDKVNVALEVFRENLFHAIPVVDEGVLVGIITTLDIINHLAKEKGATNEYR